MLIIPRILLFSGLSSSIIPPEIAWVVLIMFVPFLSALVISQVPLGWGKGHGTKVASLKRLCFPCTGIKLMAQQSPSTLDSLSCPPLPECRPCASLCPEQPKEQAHRNAGEQSQIVPAARRREKRGRRRERKSEGETEELGGGGKINPCLCMVEFLGRCLQRGVVEPNNA